MADSSMLSGIAIGLTIGVAIALGVTIILILYKPEQQTGVAYTYDDQNRLKSISPISSNIKLKVVE